VRQNTSKARYQDITERKRVESELKAARDEAQTR